jgi:hypothetical protein
VKHVDGGILHNNYLTSKAIQLVYVGSTHQSLIKEMELHDGLLQMILIGVVFIIAHKQTCWKRNETGQNS